MITISIKSQFPKLAEELKRLPDDVANPALARALNRTIEQGRTQMARSISREYNLTYGQARDRLNISRANATRGKLTLSATLSARGRYGANLIHFVERSVTFAEARRRKESGTFGHVGFKIRRGSGMKFITGPRAIFIGNNGRTVFRRTGKKRLPIEPVTTIDVPAMFNQGKINATVRGVMLEKFEPIFEREVDFYLNRWAAR